VTNKTANGVGRCLRSTLPISKSVTLGLTLSGGSSRLIVATTRAETPSAFWVQLADGLFINFRHVIDLKGRRMFEATPQSWERVEGQFAPSPLYQLSGPFQRDAPTSA